MAKKKQDSVETTKKKPPTRTGRNFNFWANPSLAQAFEDFVGSLEYETTFRTHLEKSLMEYLEKRGFWPPDEE